MAGGFSVAIGSDTRLFEQGVKTGVIEPVEDAQDALQDLAKAADKTGSGQGLDKLGKAGRDAGDDIKDGAKQADRALNDLGRSGKDAGGDVESGVKQADKALDRLGKSGKDAGDDLEDSLRGAQKQTGKTAAEYREMSEKIRAETAKIKAETKGSFEGAGGATGEFKEEALANFSEVTSSFQGDMTSITDLAQGTFGGLASMGGPASLAFGGIAVAVGLIGQALAQSGEDSDEFKEKIKDLADTRLGDLFSQYEDSGDDLGKGLRKWAQDADSFGGSLVDLQKHTRKAGVEAGGYAAAIATQSVPKMKQMRSEIEAQIRSLDKQATAQRGAGAGSSLLAKQLGEQGDAARAVKKQLDDNLKVNDAYEKSLRAVARAQGMTVDQYTAMLEAQQAASDAAEAFSESISSQASAMADLASETVSNAKVDADAYITAQQNKIDALQQFASNASSVYQDVDATTRAYLESQGTALSEEYATYLAATPDQQARLREQWAVEAKITADPTDIDAATASQSKRKTDGPTAKLKGDASDVDRKVAEKGREKAKGPTSQLKADTKEVDRKTAEQGRKRADGPTVKLHADDSSVDSKLASLRDRIVRGPTVKLGVDGSALEAYLARPRTITVNVRQGQEIK